MSELPRCQATNRAGGPCAAAHYRDNFCRWHHPDLTAERRAWAVKGGRATSYRAKASKRVFHDFRDLRGVKALLLQGMVETKQGTMEPAVLSALATAARAVVALAGVTDFAEEIATLRDDVARFGERQARAERDRRGDGVSTTYAGLERRFAAVGRDFRAVQQTAATARVPPRRTALQLAAELGLTLDDWQRDAVTTEAHDLLLLVSRQGGKGTVAMLLALAQAIGDPGSTTVVISRAERQAKRLFRRIRRAYRALDGVPPAVVDTAVELELRTGSRVLALPGSEETARGEAGVHLLILDEAAVVPDDLYGAVTPFLATTDGRRVLLSTPRGQRGFFHAAWTAEAPDWHKVRVPAEQIPRISRTFLQRERASMGDWLYRQEYLVEFLDAETQYFATALIDAAVTADIAPLALPRLGATKAAT